MDRYMMESARSVADQAFFDNEEDVAFDEAIGDYVFYANILDRYKKSIFYNRDPAYGAPFNSEECQYQHRADRDVIHGILGVTTEASELAELLLCEKVDRQKLIDECGDVLWYLALIFRSLGVTFEQVSDLNIAKLKKRFPDKFDASKAINRTTDEAEQAVFEGI